MSTADSEITRLEPERLRLVIRCGRMRTLHVCTTRQAFPRGSRVVVKTSRGFELGEVLCDATAEAVRQLQNPPGGQVVRQITPQDEQELARISERLEADFETCAQQVQASGLPMDLVDVERILGGDLLVVYFMAENRIDFRSLVKSLATALQSRIEMRQIGARDESRLLADYGDCGKPVCCNTHLIKMPPVTMRMAKLQKATLDPTKISGRCGRLKCCLRYEFETYDELQKELPAVGAQVVTAHGKARVLGQEILAQQLLVQTEDNRRILISASDVLAVTGPARNSPR